MNHDPSTSHNPETESNPRIAANRANAQLSTGPVTEEGKRRVAKNGLQHGLCSATPVLDGVETFPEWQAYSTAMIDSLSPLGAIEDVLVERITLASWRLRRLHRYETECLRKNHREHVATQQQSVARLKEQDGKSRYLRRFLRLPDNQPIASEDAEMVLRHAFFEAEVGEDSEDFEKFLEACPEGLEWNVRKVRMQVKEWARAEGVDADELFAIISDDAQESLESSKAEVPRLQKRTEEHLLQHLVPDEVTMNKILRYENHLARLFQRDLHELQRLQAARRNGAAATPIAIDINVLAAELGVREDER